MSRTITEVKDELRRLTERYYLNWHPKIKAAIEEVQAENAPKVAALKAELEALRKERPKTPRWPETTPKEIVQLCERYWRGTTEFDSFRIHEWNDKGVWTSYPSGGYSTMGGYVRTSPCYILLSRSTTLNRFGHDKPKALKELSFEPNSGQRVTPAMRLEELSKL